MSRVLSGLQPSGDLHLGNYLGAIRNWVADQDVHDAFYCIVDLHALTLDIGPDELRSRTAETALDLLAAGLDPDRCTLFVQSHVAEHPRMSATTSASTSSSPVSWPIGSTTGSARPWWCRRRPSPRPGPG